jgi:hypothetical protein
MKLLTFWAALILVYFLLTGCSTPQPPPRVQLQCGFIKPDGTLVVYYCPMPIKNGNI